MIGSLAAAAAVLVAAAGLGKLRAPVPAAAMLRRAWPRLRRVGALPRAVRLGGLAELAIGLAALGSGGRVPLALLAGCYAVFLVVSVRLAVAGRGTSCGCFGRTDSPVGAAHVVLDVAGLGVATAGAFAPAGPGSGLLDDGGLPAVVGIGQVVLLAWLAFLSITALPALAADRRRALEAR